MSGNDNENCRDIDDEEEFEHVYEGPVKEKKNPSWFVHKPISTGDSYGVVARPMYFTDTGSRLNKRLSGGWRGRSVIIRDATKSERKCNLWRIPEVQAYPDEFRSGSRVPHGWFFPVGLPGYVGRVILPTEALLFLGHIAKKEVDEVLCGATEPFLSVLSQFLSKGSAGICLQPALMMYPNKEDDAEASEQHMWPPVVEAFESLICRQKGVCGLSVTCSCDVPGGLQCSAYSAILEGLIHDSINGNKYSRVEFKCSTDGLTIKTVWMASGPDFLCTSGAPYGILPCKLRGYKMIMSYSVI